MKKILSNRGQITLEFALLLAGIVATVSIVGFYYLKSVKHGATTAKASNVETTTTTANKFFEYVDKAKEVIGNG